MVFSAPEITTVSKPNRNPASAEVSDQKNMRPFIREYRRCFLATYCDARVLLAFGERITLFAPAANAAVHRNDVCVTHLLEIVGGKRGPKTAATIKDHLGVEFWHAGLDVAFDDAFAQVDGAGEMIFGIFAFLADVDQQNFFATIHPGLNCVDVGFAHTLFCVV